MKTVEEMKMNGESYEAPKCKIIEMQTEGVLLCGSDYSATHRGFEDSDEVIW